MFKNLIGTNDMIYLISYEEGGEDESCLIIGRLSNNLSIEIIHTLYGQEAEIMTEIIKKG